MSLPDAVCGRISQVPYVIPKASRLTRGYAAQALLYWPGTEAGEWILAVGFSTHWSNENGRPAATGREQCGSPWGYRLYSWKVSKLYT